MTVVQKGKELKAEKNAKAYKFSILN